MVEYCASVVSVRPNHSDLPNLCTFEQPRRAELRSRLVPHLYWMRVSFDLTIETSWAKYHACGRSFQYGWHGKIRWCKTSWLPLEWQRLPRHDELRPVIFTTLLPDASESSPTTLEIQNARKLDFSPCLFVYLVRCIPR
ncbi:hypothetical protein PM082_019838 [Marasmius tenuissimus]|nr:hypothetical protein PM082_019838 [Marasmius tenuissimus]